MSIVNKRNAVLGWSVWTLGKRAAKKRAKGVAGAATAVRVGKKPAIFTAAGLAGVLLFWRKKKSGGESTG